MHELDRHVLGVRDAAAGSEREQTTAAGELPSHFLTCRREPVGLALEKPPGNFIAIGQLTPEHATKGIHGYFAGAVARISATFRRRSFDSNGFPTCARNPAAKARRRSSSRA
jgi:hypothetical protein